MEDANGIGHFYMLMENMGYEIKHGNRLGFRFKGQEQYYYPERQNPQYSEENIRRFIDRNLDEIDRGLNPMYIYRQPYIPYPKREKVKHTGFMALVYYYMYLFGCIEKQQYPPKMTYHLRKTLMEFEALKVQFKFLREHGIDTQTKMDAYMEECRQKLEPLKKERTILNARKKKRRNLYDALTTEERLKRPAEMYAGGDLSFAAEATEYAEAVKLLDSCGIPREELLAEKEKIYDQIAEVNFQIRKLRKDLKMCQTIIDRVPAMEKTMREVEEEPERKRKKQRER